MVRIILKACSVFTMIMGLAAMPASATIYPINVTLSGSQEAPPNSSTGTGTLVGTYNDSTNQLKYTVTFSGLSANTTAAHFHAAPPGISGSVVVAAAGFPTGVTSGTYIDSIVLTAGQEDSLKRGLWYFNIHTSALQGGEIRAQIFLQNTSFAIPDVRCPGDTTLNNDAGQCGANFAFAAQDTSGKPAPTIYYRIGNTVVTSPRVFPIGSTRVVAISYNAAGADSCSFTVTVNDTEPPVVTCPANITVPNDPGDCGAIVNFTATATDNCPGVVVSYDHAPGSFFEVGTTTVQAFATDASGNRDTCSFTVTVNDVEPPRIDSLRTTPRVLWPPNHKMRNVRVDYTTSDNCPGPINCHITVTSNEPSGGVGSHNGPDWTIIDEHHIRLRAERSGRGPNRIYTVSVHCTDQHGNSASDDTTVLVPHDLRSALIRYILGIGHIQSNSPIVLNEEFPEHSSVIRVYPNPTTNYFTINIEPANNTDRVSVRLIDLSGRVVEVRDQLYGRQTIRMGEKLGTGMYIVEVTQGNESKLFKVIKDR